MRDGLFLPDGRPEPIALEAALSGLKESDDKLGELLARVGPYGLELSMMHNPYRALARAIIGQQISGSAARAIFERVRLALGGRVFPSPAAVLGADDLELRRAGLSRQKALALKDLAAKATDGTVPSLRALQRLSDEEIIERLTRVRGVGVWTVQMLLIFRLGRPDVMPSADLGIRKGFARWFTRGRLPEPRAVERRAERWRPYRSVAAWYLWRATELP